MFEGLKQKNKAYFLTGKGDITSFVTSLFHDVKKIRRIIGDPLDTFTRQYWGCWKGHYHIMCLVNVRFSCVKYELFCLSLNAFGGVILIQARCSWVSCMGWNFVALPCRLMTCIRAMVGSTFTEARCRCALRFDRNDIYGASFPLPSLVQAAHESLLLSYGLILMMRLATRREPFLLGAAYSYVLTMHGPQISCLIFRDGSLMRCAMSSRWSGRLQGRMQVVLKYYFIAILLAPNVESCGRSI